MEGASAYKEILTKASACCRCNDDKCTTIFAFHRMTLPYVCFELDVYGRRVYHLHCVPVIMNRVEQTIAIRQIVHTCYPFTPAISLMDSLHAICRVSVFIVWRNPFHLAVRLSPSQPTPESIHFTHICIFKLDFWVHSNAVLELNRLCRAIGMHFRLAYCGHIREDLSQFTIFQLGEMLFLHQNLHKYKSNC